MKGLERGARWGRCERGALFLGIVLAGCGGKKPVGDKPATAPPMAWKYDAGEHVSIAASPDGALLVLREDSVVAVRDAKLVWEQKPGKLGSTFIPLPSGDGGGCVVVSAAEGSKLLCLSYADGSTKWTAAAPRPKAETEGGAEESPSFVVAALQPPSTLATLLSDGRWAEVTPAACAANKEDCVKGAASPTARDPSSFDSLWVGGDGLKVRNRLENVAVYDAASGKPRFVLDGKTTFFGVVTPRGKVVAGLDEDIVLVDAKACAGAEGADPPKITSKSTSADVPPGCVPKVLAQAHDPMEPVLVGEDILVVASRELRRIGEVDWKSEVDAAGSPVVAGDTVYVGCWQDTKETFVTHVDLCAVNLADGKLRFRSSLELDKLGLLDGASVVTGGDGWVFVAAKHQIGAVKTK